ncbi:TetR family transcriptional regulator [Sphaerisporangium sp. NPDC051017]|uniref:TetR/AcrR family transcriptional regulator n=1 Tax=Sphaerisporangium sp. NPDC051017 TaxID=3154636 RepID=UPI0034254E23
MTGEKRASEPDDGPEPSGAAARPAQERGRRRRAALLAAAVGLLEEGGFTAVTHRAVAGRAGLPLAATTYYFTSRDQLVSEAFALLVARELEEMRLRLEAGTAGRPRDPETLAAALAMAMGPGPGPAAAAGSAPESGTQPASRAGAPLHEETGTKTTGASTETRARGDGEGDRLRQLGLWELYLQAGRDPALQAIARDWTDGCDAMVTQVLDRAGCPSGRVPARMIGMLMAGLWMEYAVEGRPEAAREAHEILVRALRTLSPPGHSG